MTIPNSATDHSQDRTLTNMVYETNRAQILMFGGKSKNGSANADSWKLPDAGSWTQLTPTVSPSARFANAMAHSIDTGNSYIFGGLSNDLVEFNAETWHYDGTTWTKLSSLVPYSTAPSQRFAANMVSCDGYNQLLLFGGIGSTLINRMEALNSTWIFNTGTKVWSSITSTNTPDERAYFGMGYDGYNAYIFGGQGNGNIIYNDLWKINALGLQWSSISISGTKPTPRVGPAMCYDGYNNRLMIYGGMTYNGANGGLSNETFVCSASGAFSLLNTPTHPLRTYNSSMVFDSATNTIILFGGTLLDGSPAGYVATFDCVAQTWSISGDIETAQTTGTVSDH